MELGKLPQKKDRLGRTFRLSKYLVPYKIGVLPPRGVDWSGGENYPMLKNDVEPDCTCAAAGHAIVDWTRNTGSPFVPSDEQIMEAYRKVEQPGGGAYMLDVLKLWRNEGIAGHKIYAFAEADTMNPFEFYFTIHRFGGIYTGALLPTMSAYQKRWTMAGCPAQGIPGDLPRDWQRGSRGGHCMWINCHEPAGYRGPTWAEMVMRTLQWQMIYGDEAYAVLSGDWVRREGFAPNGFDYAQLERDLKTVEEIPTV